MNTFVRAHSLEIPDADEDTLGLDWDIELDDASQCLDESGIWAGLSETTLCFEDKPTANLAEYTSNSKPEPYQTTVSVGALAAKLNSSRESSPPKPKRTKRVSAKKKIEDLHHEIKELTVQLQALGGPQEKCPAPQKTSTSQLWKQIAQRQQEQREMSEEENRKLREMMEVQTLEAKSLQQVLKRRKKTRDARKHTRSEILPQAARGSLASYTYVTRSDAALSVGQKLIGAK
ncbi:uncharacterized protein IUM83_05019 [Phytophthora cinnamomi]|uniref:uncharacterized protein n=1 Tax=Phytophthora cinnamomi TaxID=4785 RepID=UPI003559657D|nr:hypothetical protein IUM83_05019 [Phytophthora cinnamomi]